MGVRKKDSLMKGLGYIDHGSLLYGKLFIVEEIKGGAGVSSV